MSPDEQSKKGLTETCPFCGRSFKRLKSHITRCKMAPVTKSTKTPEQLSVEPSAPRRNLSEKPGTPPTKRQGQPSGTAAGLGDGAKARPNKKSPKVQDVPPGGGGKVKVTPKAQGQSRGGAEGAESRRERAAPVEHPHVRGATLAPSKPARKRTGPVTTAVGGRGSYAETAEAPPLRAPGKAAESSPAKPPVKPRAPESRVSRGSPQFPASPGGGAVAQSSPRVPFVARIQAAEGALRRPPRARSGFWEDVPSADQLTLRTGSGSSDRGWTKTSVWEHIREGFTCRSPAPAPKTPAPTPSHTPSAPSHSLPVLSHTPPAPSHTLPAPSHTLPALSHTPPAPSHTLPAPSHTLPALSHTPPAPSHTLPAPSHTLPALSHTPPAPSHTLPAPSHTLPALSHTPPAPSHTPSHTSSAPSHTLPAPSHTPPALSHMPPAFSHTPTLATALDRETARLPTLASAQDRETARLPTLASQAGSHAPPSEPCPGPLRGVERGARGGIRCPLGLEGAPELAAAYEGIGLSMLPVRSLAHTERVQQEAPPTQRPTPGSQGSLPDRVLMEVRLAELPAWFTARSLLTPREAAAAVHRGWRRYYGKYIDVRRGGIGGVAMLLAGYCVLSYLWSYPHLKRDRWRKYH